MGKLKMSDSHYQTLNSGIVKLLDTLPGDTASKGLDSMRVRWDLYWKSGSSFSNAQEYQYLNDNHIDSALKVILTDYLTCPKCGEIFSDRAFQEAHINDIRS